jgi:hypothetical protein
MSKPKKIKVEKIKVGQVLGLKVKACGDKDSVWVELDGKRVAPDRARVLAALLEVAATTAEAL